MKKETLNDIELSVWTYILQYVADSKWSPTLEEIGEELKMSRSNAHYYVRKLSDKGYLSLSDRKYRNIEIIN